MRSSLDKRKWLGRTKTFRCVCGKTIKAHATTIAFALNQHAKWHRRQGTEMRTAMQPQASGRKKRLPTPPIPPHCSLFHNIGGRWHLIVHDAMSQDPVFCEAVDKAEGEVAAMIAAVARGAWLDESKKQYIQESSTCHYRWVSIGNANAWAEWGKQ